MNIYENGDFLNAYNALNLALERKDSDSNDSSDRERIVRLVLEVHDLARTPTEKMQLRSLVGRVEKVNDDPAIPDSERLRKVLRIWKGYSTENAGIVAKRDPVFQGITDGAEIAGLLSELQKIPIKQRAEILEKATPVLEGITDGKQRVEILVTIRQILDMHLGKDSIEKVLPFLKGITDYAQRAFILMTIGEIPENQRTETVIRSITALFQGIADEEEKVNLYLEIYLMPSQARADVLEKTFPVLGDMMEGDRRVDILNAVREIPANKRTLPLVKAIVSLLQGITNPDQRFSILRAIEKISEDQRADVIEKAVSICQDLSDGNQRAIILSAIETISEDQRADVIEKAVSICQDVSDGERRTIILRAIEAIPENQRTEGVIRSIPFLFHGCTDGIQTETIFCAVVRISANQRAYVIEKALPLFRDVSNVMGRVGILRVMQYIPEELRSDVIEKALPILIKDGRQTPYILLVIVEIPVLQRTSTVIQSIDSLFRGGANESEKANIFRTIQDIPEERRAEAIEKTASVLSEISNGHARSDILRFMLGIPPRQMTSAVIRSIAGLFEGIAYEAQRQEIFVAFERIPIEKRADFVERTFPILQGILYGRARGHALSLLQLLDVSRDDNVLEGTIRFFLDLDPLKRIYCLNMLEMFAPEDRWEVVDFYKRRSAGFDENTLVELFRERPVLVNTTRNYLAEWLDVSVSDPVKARNIALNILSMSDALLIHEEHPLFQRSLEVLSITDPALMENAKNPYRFHLELKRLVETEPLQDGLGRMFQEGEKRIAVSLAPLRMAQKIYVVKDLPKESDPNGFQRMFVDIQERAKTVPAMEREIESSYAKSLSELAVNIVQGPFIQRCLRIPEGRDEPVENTTFYLYGIYHFLSQLSNEPAKADLLSPRERALLAFAEAVRNCRTGQLDGVAGYYNNLPVEFRTGATAATTTQKKLADFMDVFVRSTVLKILTGDEMLRELSGQSGVSNESHQTLYLKNRLCKQLGLLHQMQFDMSTAYIDDRIANASVDDLMQTFFRYYTPGKLVSDLFEEIDRSLKDPGSGLMIPLDEFFEAQGGKEGLLLYDEASDKIKISDEGALLLLESFGYVEDLSKA